MAKIDRGLWAGLHNTWFCQNRSVKNRHESDSCNLPYYRSPSLSTVPRCPCLGQSESIKKSRLRRKNLHRKITSGLRPPSWKWLKSTKQIQIHGKIMSPTWKMTLWSSRQPPAWFLTENVVFSALVPFDPNFTVATNFVKVNSRGLWTNE